MKANSEWVKTDYKVQTFLGWAIVSMIVCGILGLLISRMYGYFILCLAMLLLMPIGAWQVISGLVYAFKGDRLQQIYLGVVAVYFAIWYFAAVYHSDFFVIMLVIAAIIAVWKYTVVRADYISLKIINVSNIDDTNLLDA